MMDRLRRVVTGHDAERRSIVIIDGPPGNRFGSDISGLAEVWNSEPGPLDGADVEDRAAGPVVVEPPAGGSTFRFFAIAPEDPTLSREEQEERAAAGFAAMGAAHTRRDTTRHPRMHETRTIDYIILLKGRVKLLLEDDERDLEPFDVIVQRGTNHAFINTGDEPALLAAVMVDAEIA